MITTTLAGTDSPSHSRGPLRLALRLARVELRVLAREPLVAVGLLGFPVVTMLVIAGVFGQVPDPDFGGVAPDDHYIAGYLGIVLAALGLTTIPVHIATSRELGVTRRFRASGVSAPVLVAAQVMLGTVLGVMAGSVVLIVGSLAYGMQAPADPAAVVAWYVAGLLCFIAIGGALGSVMPTGRSANAIGNLLFVPMFLLGGGGPPRAVMTGAMRTLSDALPLTHLVGGLRESWLGTTDDPHALWWPLLLTVVSVLVMLQVARRRAT